MVLWLILLWEVAFHVVLHAEELLRVQNMGDTGKTQLLYVPYVHSEVYTRLGDIPTLKMPLLPEAAGIQAGIDIFQ